MPLAPPLRLLSRALAAASLIVTGLVLPGTVPTAAAATCGTANAAQGKPATASSTENAGIPAANAVDGNTGTRWSSAFSDPQWLQVDLGSAQTICQVDAELGGRVREGVPDPDLAPTAPPGPPSTRTTTGTGGIQTLDRHRHRPLRPDERHRPRPPRTATRSGSSHGRIGHGDRRRRHRPAPASPTGGRLRPERHRLRPEHVRRRPSRPRSTRVFNTQKSNQFGTQRYALLFKPGTYSGSTPTSASTPRSRPRPEPGRRADQRRRHRRRRLVRRQRDAELLAVGREPGDQPVRRHRPLGRRAGRAVPPDGRPRRPEPRPGQLRLGQRRLHRRQPGSPARPSAVLAAAVVHPGQQHRQLDRRASGTWCSPASAAPRRRASRTRRTPRWPPPRSPATKPYLYVDATRQLPRVRAVACGPTRPAPSWANGTTPGTSLPMSQFYVANPGDTRGDHQRGAGRRAATCSSPRASTTSTRRSTSPAPNTVVLGLGYPTLIPDNGVNADAGRRRGRRPARGPAVRRRHDQLAARCCRSARPARRASHAGNPTSIQDVFFRIGGDVAGKATTSLVVNSNNTIIDHIWAWRADHGNRARRLDRQHGRHRPDRQRQQRPRDRPVRRALPEVRGASGTATAARRSSSRTRCPTTRRTRPPG